GHKRLQFEGPNVHDTIQAVGNVPLPPYIHRHLEEPERYQTVYASHGGSAAAPTAGLHFTETLLGDLASRGIQIVKVTLDVGIDTFRPILVDELDQHKMHGETCTITPETADIINRAKGRVIAVGTTVVRTLESLAVEPRAVRAGSTSTHLFIRPGHQFQVIDGMFTNFHLPGTTMMVMLSALIGRENLLHAYKIAVENRYRFLSFGDSMLIL
ncbi:MAG TPA: S-adenosylmethionine:tRNA ribosyltransferase-isomerase, partial [Fimbriimonadaceae bacterium]|nr:S-adenosylmethionine:tRNA ribosyltransferase-isomerase [Fimbriimonadaceae bacterium]